MTMQTDSARLLAFSSAIVIMVLAAGILCAADSEDSDATTVNWTVGTYEEWNSGYTHNPKSCVADFSGSLPPGLSVTYKNVTMWVTGTPTSSGTYNLTMDIFDINANPQERSVPVTFVISASTPETYTHTATLKFNVNGGTGSFDTQTQSVTSTSSSATGSHAFAIPSGTPTRSGYVFDGWFPNNASAIGGVYYSGNTINVSYGSTTTMYAIWKEITETTCYVYYDANGGGTPPHADTFTSTSTDNHAFTVVSTVPILIDHICIGWSTDSKATSAEYTAGDTISVPYNGSVTLYAVWNHNTFTCFLKYDAKGGNNAPDMESYTGESNEDHMFVVSSDKPSKTGASFLGWSTDYNATSVEYVGGDEITATSTQTLFLYAVWHAAIKIAYDVNGGTTSLTELSVDVLSGNTYRLLTKGFARDGYYLSSWNTASDGTGTAYALGTTITLQSTDLTFYAQYTKLPDTNDGSAPTTATVGILYRYVPDADGDNWWTIVKEIVTNSRVTFSSCPDWLSTHTVTANSIVFSGTPGTDDIGVHVVALDATYTNGFSVSISWVITVSPADEGTIYAISFNVNGGEGTLYSQYGYADTFVELPSYSTASVTKEGYTLGGWSTTIDGTMVIYPLGSVYTIHGNKVFSAVWVADTHVIVFDVNGGIGETAYQTADTDSLVTLPGEGYAKSGYTLNGWYISNDSSTIYALGYTYKVSATTVFKAYWVATGTTTIKATFNANGGVGGFSMNVESGKKVVMPVYGITYTGNVLQKWNTAAGGIGTEYAMGATAKIAASTTFYAQWISSSSNTFTITFDLNGGQGSVAPQVLSSGDTVSEPNAPTRYGYLFSGWRVVGGSSWDFETAVTENMTFEAQWDKLASITASGTMVTLSIASGYFSGNSTIVWGDSTANSTGVSATFTHDYGQTSSGTITVTVNLAGDSHLTTLLYSVTSSSEGATPGDDGGDDSEETETGTDWKKIAIFAVVVLIGIFLLTRVI